MPNKYANLGGTVSTRETSWSDLAQRAWGAEFQAPDHNVYPWSNGRQFDSTDRNQVGIYGVVGEDILYYDGRYEDMKDGLDLDYSPVNQDGALNLPFGKYDEVGVDTQFIPIPGLAPPLSEFDYLYANVSLLIHNTLVDTGPLLLPIVTTGVSNIDQRSIIPSAQPFLGDTLCMYQNAVATSLGSSWGYISAAVAAGAFDNATNEPFTIEWAQYSPVVGLFGYLMGEVGAAGLDVFLSNTAALTGGLSSTVISAVMPLNTWHQCAICYDGTKCTTYFNGTLANTLTTTRPLKSAVPFAVFATPTSSGIGVFRGYLKEIRVTKGVQRYGVSYIPRTTPFPNQGPPPGYVP